MQMTTGEIASGDVTMSHRSSFLLREQELSSQMVMVYFAYRCHIVHFIATTNIL